MERKTWMARRCARDDDIRDSSMGDDGAQMRDSVTIDKNHTQARSTDIIRLTMRRGFHRNADETHTAEGVPDRASFAKNPLARDSRV